MPDDAFPLVTVKVTSGAQADAIEVTVPAREQQDSPGGVVEDAAGGTTEDPTPKPRTRARATKSR
ncbi:hypothetical protein ACFC1T_09585 [Kitasatospora sp. NPDC056076]|uniref:hypothetical protein n=1 Tax=Kitasatospora sp. NPDC056076 TaxID=3345703 RepID=UPI0035D5E25A